jgi:hypothetical protein
MSNSPTHLEDDTGIITSATEFQIKREDPHSSDFWLPDDADLHFIRARFFEIALEVFRLRSRPPTTPT